MAVETVCIRCKRRVPLEETAYTAEGLICEECEGKADVDLHLRRSFRFQTRHAVATALLALVALLLVYVPRYSHLVLGRSLGETCREAADCRSGMCLAPKATRGPMTLQGLCSRDCRRSQDCDHGLRCLQMGAAAYCAPNGSKTFAAPCLDDWDCASGVCVGDPKLTFVNHLLGSSVGSAFHCSQRCAKEADCPSGSVCRELGSHQTVCVSPQMLPQE